jgi:GMP synthase-like glutamine amidotransferase
MSKLRIAILDLYDGQANEGMRCIRALIRQWAAANGIQVYCEEFDVRGALQLPDTSFDLYLSSGGPGSPLESEGSEWENRYFRWITSIELWNQGPSPHKKHIFFICHSFQLACRYYQAALVCKRKSTSFGIFPVHMLENGLEEPVFRDLQDPFYAVDSRDYQVIRPDYTRLQQLGGHILAIEKERPHVPYERAVMAIRFNEYAIGTQFHPEADAAGMSMYLQRADKKNTVIENHGEQKWQSMIEHLHDPDKIHWTYSHVLPNFLNHATALPVAATAGMY